MSSSTNKILARVRKMVPPLSDKFHKGQAGRIAVIGGSEDYTGAPYFSAMAAALLGADMCHVICEPGAGQVIKTYNPSLMIHPYMRQKQHVEADSSDDQVLQRVLQMLDRLHVVIVGPGLGRDELMQSTVHKVVVEARKRKMPVVIDADGLYMVQNYPETVKGYQQVVLTPNVVEFGRLCKTMNVDQKSGDPNEVCAKLAKALGGVTIVQKGGVDRISNGSKTLTCDVPGTLKRAGGQGDTLSGTLGTLLAWKKAYQDKLWDHDNDLEESEMMLLAAFGASALTRAAAHLAFQKTKRAMLASDLVVEVGNAYEKLLGTESPKL